MRARNVAKVLVGAGAAAATTFIAAPGAASASVGEIGLFQNTGYGGCAYYSTTIVGMYTMAGQYYNAGAGCSSRSLNHDVSSIANGYYCSTRFYTVAGYTGNYQTLAARSQVSSVKYNDAYRSWQVINCS